MPYCVNCGVELNKEAARCPLCRTPVWHPEKEAPGEPFFPTQRAVVVPVSKMATALVLSAMLLSAALCCGLLNLLLPTEHPWSFYVIGAAVMLWVWLVPPLLLRRMPGFLRLTLDVAAIGVYVWLISLSVDGEAWFRGLALPILGAACAIVFVLSFLLRGWRRSILTSATLLIGALGIFLLCVEYCGDRYFHGEWTPGWSLIPAAICAALIIPLVVIRRVPLLREEARRRFSL